jgi:hypothetical protein
MGVGAAEPKEQAATAAGAPAEEDKAAAVSCSICLDAVLAASGERSTARLHCGHEFHLGKLSLDLSVDCWLVVQLRVGAIFGLGRQIGCGDP